MIAQELEISLHLAFVEARQKRHQFITVEHLLLAMLDNPSAAHVLRACGADIEELRAVLADFINTHTPLTPGSDDVDTQPTVGFQRVIQRAILHVQSTKRSLAPTYWSLCSVRRIRTRCFSLISAPLPGWM